MICRGADKVRYGAASHGVLSLRPLRSLRLKHQGRYAVSGRTLKQARLVACIVRGSVEDGQRRSSRYDAQGASFSLFRPPIRRVKTERQGDGRVCRVKRLCTARESQAFSAVGMAGGECLQCHVMDGSTIFRSENHRRIAGCKTRHSRVSRLPAKNLLTA